MAETTTRPAAVEVCFDEGGRVRLEEIPVNPDRPPWGCSGCFKPIEGGDAFFIEVDDMARSGWGVGLMAVCAPCLALALKPRNLSALSRKESPGG